MATRSDHLGIDFEFYLPETWTRDEVRRKEARVRVEVTFKTKPERAPKMIDRALAAGVFKGVVLTDEGYRQSSVGEPLVHCRMSDQTSYRPF